MNVKLFLVSILLLAALIYWILPKTRLSQKIKMSIGLFYTMNIIGILCGVLGLLVTFAWPDKVLEQHYFELILLPTVFVYLYLAMIGKMQGKTEILDEKQNQNMTQAAAITWPASIGAVFLLYAMYNEGILTGLVFFPVFLFFLVCLIFSKHIVLFYKKLISQRPNYLRRDFSSIAKKVENLKLFNLPKD